MRFNRRFAIGFLITGVAVILGTIAMGLHLRSSAGNDSTGNGRFLNSISWRGQLYLRKMLGAMPDLSWSELSELTSAPGGSNLEGMIDNGSSLEGSLVNPFVSAQDTDTGARLFHERCAACHGNNAGGWHAPSLLSGLKHGDSAMSMYRVIRDGIPSTNMVSQDLLSRERWQIVGFLGTLRAPASKLDADQPSFAKIVVSGEDISNAGGATDAWLTYSGALSGSRYSQMSEINSKNVSKLRIRWIKQFETDATNFQATPLVVSDRIFLSEPLSNVVALDAKSGATIWKYDRVVPDGLSFCCSRVNRGLAILGGTLFLGALDGHLVAIDASNGKVIWDTLVADPSEHYTLTGAPLIVNNTVVVGVAGGDFGARGFLAAYDAATGQQRWRFQTIPDPGDPGHESWMGESWRNGGGATWTTGSYDPELGLVYWGVGNPAPVFSGDVRQGDNLFTSSVIALHANSGKLAWHFQFTPHDEHDWDSAQTPILADVSIAGEPRKVICWFNRNGFYYVLDRISGKFLLGTPYVNQNWAKGLDASGRPILSNEAGFSNSGLLTRPGVVGGTNWQPAALDQRMGLVFVHAIEGASVFTKSRTDKIERGKAGFYLGSSGGDEIFDGSFVRALDIVTGTKKWEYPSPKTNASNIDYTGLLATAGGLVFGASAGYLFAIDSTTGNECWRVNLGGPTRAPPISFAIDGHQVIAVSAGRAFFIFEL